MKSHAILSYLFVGIPGGLLIFMGALTFNALLGKLIPVSQWTMLPLLCLTALTVGLLARWMRPYHGLGTAVAAGLVAAAILLILWQEGKAGPVFGLAGVLAAVGFSALGGWLLPRLKKPKR